MLVKLALRSLLRRPAQHLLLLLLLAAAAALPVFLIQMTAGLYNGLNRAAEPFPILAGAKGSPYQLVINTVFLRDHPIGNISYAEADRLRAGGKADLVLPLAFGDNYAGMPVVGTEKEIFDYRPRPAEAPWLRVAEGRTFSAPREAVIGTEAARRTGLAVGGTFRTIHGAAGGHEHEENFTVTGILAPVGGPYDTAILIDISDVWASHAKKETHRGGIAGRGAPPATETAPAVKAPEGRGDATALLVHPTGYKEAMQLLYEAQNNRKSEMQLIFPAQTLIALYAMAGQSREFWTLLAGGLIGAAVLIAVLAMYWQSLARMAELALLRALGMGSGAVMRLLLLEECLLLTAGAAGGWCAGWLASCAAARAMAGRAAIVMTTTPEPLSLLPPLLILAAGTLAALIPAHLVRKKDISKYL